jgi:hypothetical protein
MLGSGRQCQWAVSAMGCTLKINNKGEAGWLTSPKNKSSPNGNMVALASKTIFVDDEAEIV